MKQNVYDVMNGLVGKVAIPVTCLAPLATRPEPEPSEPADLQTITEEEIAYLAKHSAAMEPEPAYIGRISSSIYCDKRADLAVFKRQDRIEVVLRDLTGGEHYGLLKNSLLAEGGFRSATAPEDKAYMNKIYEAVVKPELYLNDNSDFNYTKRATCLWTNRDLTGAPHSRAFLVMTWGGRPGSQYAAHAMLMDGDVIREFDMERQTVRSSQAPLWKGLAR